MIEVRDNVFLDPQHAEALLPPALGVPEAFPWQRALLRKAIQGELPRAVDVATGLGKTAVIAIWLLARAAGARLPRRLVYVVDRRAVVDQATEEAERLRAFVEQHPEVNAALGLDGPLPISTLRGRYVDNRAWLEDPSSTAIVVGTVDMVGSRLLFSGYGVSRKMRPYHAGLLGADALYVLDEAHLVPAFERLLETITGPEGHALRPEGAHPHLIPKTHLLSLSATGRAVTDAHRLDEEDRTHPVVQRRMGAEKRMVLKSEVAAKDLAQALADEALALLEANGAEPARLVIFCNRRADATRISTIVEKKLKGKVAIELMVGARRIHERQEVARWLAAHGFTKGEGDSAALTLPAILIATSAGEVGVDFDAQHAVFDVVPWERMVQRLGRVNRRGAHRSTVVVVPAGADTKDEKEKARLEVVRILLEELPPTDSGRDGSPGALVALKERAGAERIRSASSPVPLHPPLTLPHVEAWAMTWLEEHTGRAEVGPWLRGWEEDEEPQALVFFRAVLPLLDGALNPELLAGYLEDAGPHAAEQLEVAARELKDWLVKRAALLLNDPNRSRGWRETPIVIVHGKRGTRTLSPAQIDAFDNKRLEDSLAGATVVVAASFGGLTHGLLDPNVPEPDGDMLSLDLTERDDSGVPFRLRGQTESDPMAVDGFRPEKRFVIGRDTEGAPNRWIQLERRVDATAVTEVGRSVARRAQGLAEHGEWSKTVAERLAERLELATVLKQALIVATHLHDEGKAAERWQRAFGVRLEQRPLAKSTRGANQMVLGGYRHELGSLPRMERRPEFETLNLRQRELALHLVAAHHGRARPILPTEGAEEPPEKIRARAQEVTLRYDRLSREYGPWGLAWLESLLRAADARASRQNDEGASNG